MIEILPAHKIQYFRFKNMMCKVLNSTAIASGYAGGDPQGGTSDGSLFSKFSFMLQLIVVKVRPERKWQIKKMEKLEVIFTMKLKKYEKDWEFGDLH